MANKKTRNVRKTKNQIAWEREYRNLKKRIKSAQRRGYSFDNIEIHRPKRITKKDIETLHNLRGYRLLRQGTFTVDGRTMSGYQGYQYEQRLAAEKRRGTINEAELIIDNIIAMLNNKWFGAGPVKYRLINFINRIVMLKGATAVARILKEDADKGQWEINREVAYNFDGAQDAWIQHITRALDAPQDIINDVFTDTDDGVPLGDTEDVWTEKIRPSR